MMPRHRWRQRRNYAPTAITVGQVLGVSQTFSPSHNAFGEAVQFIGIEMRANLLPGLRQRGCSVATQRAQQ
jgi:hypothetical protein